MATNGENERTASAEITDAAQGVLRAGSRIAPAVALLLLGDSVHAQPDEDDGVSISEPTTIGLLAAAAAVGGVVAYIRSKRRK